MPLYSPVNTAYQRSRVRAAAFGGSQQRWTHNHYNLRRLAIIDYNPALGPQVSLLCLYRLQLRIVAENALLVER